MGAASKEHTECVSIAEEKVALAEQTYELVDGHVRRLDAVRQRQQVAGAPNLYAQL